MSHLTHEQRYTISCMLKQNYSQTAIGLAIGRDKSVISREIKRNCDKRDNTYRADLATKKYNNRQRDKPKAIKFTIDIKKNIETLLREDLSPEQINGVMKKDGMPTVSTERIYQHIWADKKSNGTLYKHLRREGKRYRKRGASKDSRGIIKDRVTIDKRPKIVELRDRFGDLEFDLIIGKNHQQAILTINDRTSGMLKMAKVANKKADTVALSIINLLEEWKPYLHTVTADNGKEFAEHKLVASELNVEYYFAQPYHPWERGSNENLNGLIRQYFKKGSDFTKLTIEEIKMVENKINNRPRKRFNYETPIFVMNKLLFNPKVAFVA